MHDEPQVGLVEPHAERGRRHEGLDPVAEQVLLEGLALGGVGLPGVCGDRVALLGQQARQIPGRRHGECVDDARAGQAVELLGEPRGPGGGLRNLHDRQVQRLAFEAAAEDEGFGATHPELRGDVGDDAVVRRGRGGQDGDSSPSSAISVRIRR